MLLRIDDVCGTTDPKVLDEMITCAQGHGFHVAGCVSPLYFSRAEPQHAFPLILMAKSDHRQFFKTDLCSSQKVCRYLREKGVEVYSHGLVHVDHRLLCKGAQELSIIAAASLLGSRVFVPPFNKWNEDTEEICREEGIGLIKWEDGWQHVMYNRRTVENENYYVHPYDLTPAALRNWMEA